MSEQNARDKQFQNFANAVYMECFNVYQEAELNGRMHAEQYVIQHIARRAYDLVGHAIGYLSCQDVLDFSSPGFGKYEYVAGEMVEVIPDMTELPKEQGD